VAWFTASLIYLQATVVERSHSPLFWHKFCGILPRRVAVLSATNSITSSQHDVSMNKLRSFSLVSCSRFRQRFPSDRKLMSIVGRIHLCLQIKAAAIISFWFFWIEWFQQPENVIEFGFFWIDFSTVTETCFLILLPRSSTSNFYSHSATVSVSFWI